MTLLPQTRSLLFHQSNGLRATDDVFKVHLFDLLWICCTTSCTTSPQQVHDKSTTNPRQIHDKSKAVQRIHNISTCRDVVQVLSKELLLCTLLTFSGAIDWERHQRLFYCSCSQLSNELIKQLTDWMTDWLIDWLIDLFIYLFIYWFIDLFIYWFIDLLIYWLMT